MGVNKKPELLVPAGSLEVLKTAVRYGADAVYIGGEEFSLRAKAKNFSKEDMAEGIKLAAEIIDSGKAEKTLEKFIEVSNRG